jgi:hypothetical protein
VICMELAVWLSALLAYRRSEAQPPEKRCELELRTFLYTICGHRFLSERFVNGI